MTGSLLAILILTFCISTLLFRILLRIISEKGRYEKRINKYITGEKIDQHPEQEIAKKAPKKTYHAPLRNAGKKLEQAINLVKYEKLLIQSGVALSPGELFIGRIMLAIIGMLLGYIYGLHIILIILCGLIGYGIPIMYIKNRRKKRLKQCSEQLGEAIGTMANALRAGFSFLQAMKTVGNEVEGPLGKEFRRTLQEINYGISVEEAFTSLSERLPDKDIEMVLNTLIIQRSSGGNLAFLLETMQETIIDRQRIKGEVKTLTAQGRMSSIIITVLPLALALYLQLVNPEYFHRLFNHPVGWIMIALGSINLVFGWLFIRKIVHVEV